MQDELPRDQLTTSKHGSAYCWLTKMRSAALRPHRSYSCSPTAGRNVSSNAG
jgi:hypothetical protein